MKKILKAIKYRRAHSIFDELVSIISPDVVGRVNFYKKLKDKKLIIHPLPLHPTRERIRGFNQALLVSRFVSGVTGLTLQKELLSRTKPTKPQAQLESRLERYQNVRAAFHVGDTNKVKEASILLVDDVVTSGATVKEASSSLKRAGASDIFVFSLAKG